MHLTRVSHTQVVIVPEKARLYSKRVLGLEELPVRGDPIDRDGTLRGFEIDLPVAHQLR